jgi:AcrR family transcriptional regulator
MLKVLHKPQLSDLSLQDYPGHMGAPSGSAVPPLLPAVESSIALRAAQLPDPQLRRTQVTPAAAFQAAKEMFLRGERLDMQALAAELGISRTTLYRWTGRREQLLSDVLWTLSNELLERAKADHPEHTGAPRVLAIFRQHVGALVRARALQTFLRQETHAALRVLTLRGGGVQRRTVREFAELLREEQEAGGLRLRADVESLAYAIVRMTEGFIYNDAIASVEPEVERAAGIVALLLESSGDDGWT